MTEKKNLIKKLKDLLDEDEWDKVETQTIVLYPRLATRVFDFDLQEHIFQTCITEKYVPFYFYLGPSKSLTVENPNNTTLFVPPCNDAYHFGYLKLPRNTAKEFARLVKRNEYEILRSMDEHNFYTISIPRRIACDDANRVKIEWSPSLKDMAHYIVIHPTKNVSKGFTTVTMDFFELDKLENWGFRIPCMSMIMFFALMQKIIEDW
jgi:hypothetical protein